MKKVFLSIAVVAMAFILSGCGAKDAAQNNPNATPEALKDATDSIKKAMGLGTKMKCEYSLKTGNVETTKSTVYVEGKKFKSTGLFSGVASNTVFDGDVMYSWQEGQKTGIKMVMSCMNELKASLPEDQQDNAGAFKDPEEQFIDGSGTSCAPTTEKIDFSVPNDITFTDQCEMMKKSMEMMKNMKLPEGMPANLPNIPVQE